MKLTIIFKCLLPLMLLAVGLLLITTASRLEKTRLQGLELFEAASAAARDQDYETAYLLYIQSSYEFQDPHLKAVALYEAATVGWVGNLADYQTLVGLYQQALRYDPDLYEAAFDLEYLYFLKAKQPDQLPNPVPGFRPGEEKPTDGDF